MFLFIGLTMTLIQGGYVRRIKPGTHIQACIKAIVLIMPGFVLIAMAHNQLVLHLGLLLYSYSSSVVVQCFTTLMSTYGKEKICINFTSISLLFKDVHSEIRQGRRKGNSDGNWPISGSFGKSLWTHLHIYQ